MTGLSESAPPPAPDQTARPARRVWTESHEPRGGMQRLLGSLYVSGVFWFGFANRAARSLPEWMLPAFVWVMTCWCFCLLLRVRRGISRNLDIVLGRAGFFRRQVRIFKTLLEFGWCTIDRYTLFHDPSRLHVQFEGAAHWQEALGSPGSTKGFVLVSAHLGNWEVGARMPATVDVPIHVVREPAVDPRAQAMMERLFAREQQSNPKLRVHFADRDPALGTKLLFALRRGEVVGLAGDQPRFGQSYTEVEMFGRPTPLPHGVAALARAADVPLLPVFVVRLGRLRYRVIVRPPIHIAHTADRDDDIARATQALADEMAWAFACFPHSWFCWWPRW